MGPSSSPSYPTAPEEERKLWQAQTDILNKMQRQYAGLEPIYNKYLNIRNINTETPEWTSWNAANTAYQEALKNPQYSPTRIVGYRQFDQGEGGFTQEPIYGQEMIPIASPGQAPERYTTTYEEIPYGEREKTPADVLAENQLLMEGFKVDPNTGKTGRATEEEILTGMTKARRQQYDLQQMAGERERQALAGELPIPQVVEDKLSEGERVQTDQLEKMLGPNWALSTPGQNLRVQQEQSRAAIRSGVQQGSLDSAAALDQINSNINAVMSGQTGALQSQMYGAGLQQYGQMMGLPSRTAGLLSPYGELAGVYQQERVNQYTGELQGQATGAQRWKGAAAGAATGAALGTGSGGPGYGTAIGAGIGGLIGYFSGKKMKKNIKKIPPQKEEDVLKEMMGTKHYEYDYKGEPDNSRKYMGMMANEAPESVTDGKTINVQNMLGLHNMALKALAKKVERLGGKK